jgi:uncharacterized membrane protein
MYGFTYDDILAMVFFIFIWFGYAFFSDKTRYGKNCVNQIMEHYRYMWFRTMLKRDQRMVDTGVMNGLQNGTAFFASTSLLAIGGALSLIPSTEKLTNVVENFPFFVVKASPFVWEAKLSGLALIFVYAFFKLAWAYRLFNYSAIMIGAAPVKEFQKSEQALIVADKGARLNIVASRHFNKGLRAFFFALGYLGWFVHPYVLIVTTGSIAFILYQRQFASDALEAIKD